MNPMSLTLGEIVAARKQAEQDIAKLVGAVLSILLEKTGLPATHVSIVTVAHEFRAAGQPTVDAVIITNVEVGLPSLLEMK